MKPNNQIIKLLGISIDGDQKNQGTSKREINKETNGKIKKVKSENVQGGNVL